MEERKRKEFPEPVRLRAIDGKQIGTTAFFRNRALLRALIGRIEEAKLEKLKILFHSTSFGPEVYSFLIALSLNPNLAGIEVEAVAVDRSEIFLWMLQAGVYGEEILSGMTAEEASFFDRNGDGTVTVCPRIKRKVRFLPSTSFVEFTTEEKFDVVFLLNSLLYVDAESQSQTLRNIATYNQRWLAITGFHMDRIKSDIQTCGYSPILDDIEEIHNGWTDRRVKDAESTVIPGVTFHYWGLPEFSKIEDYEFKYCALYEKRDVNSACS